MKRYSNLDYLRGLAAFFIMLYHFIGLGYSTEFDSSSILGRLGVFCVSIFYIVSGLTLYLVYFEKFNFSKTDILDFSIKRVLRIFPLLWLVISFTVLIKGAPSLKTLLLNMTGLFGFVKPTAYIGMGMWSIGNELVFYFFFPFLIYLLKNYIRLFYLTLLLVFAVFTYFTFISINSSIPLSEQWDIYINPFNQIYLFVLGILVGHLFRNITISTFLLFSIFLVGILVFCYWPVEGNTVNLVSGYNRIIFLFSILLITLCFYKNVIQLPNIIHRVLSKIGEISYGIYLLHPLVWSLLVSIKPIKNLQVNLIITLSIIITLIISHISFNYFEKYFIKIGKLFSGQLLKLVSTSKP